MFGRPEHRRALSLTELIAASSSAQRHVPFPIADSPDEDEQTLSPVTPKDDLPSP
jgi:hypothetical protein